MKTATHEGEIRNESIKEFLSTLTTLRGQALTSQDVSKVNNNVSFWGFLRVRGFGNWIAAMGIAASAIAPLLAGGFPYWVTITALLLGLIFWRETNFGNTRRTFAMLSGVKDKKTQVFHERVYDLLKELELDTNIDDNGKLERLAEFIVLQASYNSIKSKFKNKVKTDDNHVASLVEKILINHGILISGNPQNYQNALISGNPQNYHNAVFDPLLKEYLYAYNLLMTKTLEVAYKVGYCNEDGTVTEDLGVGCISLHTRVGEECNKIEGFKQATWVGHVNEHFSEIMQYKSVRDLVQKQNESIENNKSYPLLITMTKRVIKVIAVSAAIIGNALGCFVAGLNLAGFIWLTLGFSSVPLWASLGVASTMGFAGYWAYDSNTGPAIQSVFKQCLYEILKLVRGNSHSNKKVTWRTGARITMMILGVICSIVMGIAIGTFNLQFGDFLVATIMNPSILTNASALANLVATSTSLGTTIGYVSGALVAFGTTALFLRYIVTGLMDLIPAEEDIPLAKEVSTDKASVTAVNVQPVKESSVTFTDVAHTIFKLLVMACVTFFSVYSVAYFVGLSVPLALKSMAMITIYVTGSVVYIAQSYNVAKEFLVDYGNILGNSKACLTKQQEIGLVVTKAKNYKENTTPPGDLEARLIMNTNIRNASGGSTVGSTVGTEKMV